MDLGKRLATSHTRLWRYAEQGVGVRVFLTCKGNLCSEPISIESLEAKVGLV
jgi:hypothetical protein